ncbi:type II/IV secretion system protein [Candidatus Falkowbacteria bacterium]|nr:type II/IV secretion system protein [Candidatus Falkowbacteria bacterium]
MSVNFNGFEKIRDALQARGLISPELASQITKRSFATSDVFFSFLLKGSEQREDDLYRAIAEVIVFPYLDLRGEKVAADVLETIPFTVAQNYKIVAFKKTGAEVHVGLVDPYDFQAIEAIEFLIKQKKLKVKYYLITPTVYQELLRQYSDFTKEVEEALAEVQLEDEASGETRDREQAEQQFDFDTMLSQAPVSKIVSEIVKQGVVSRASDIHIEPVPEGSRIRYRVDGVLRTALTLPAYIHSSLISRIKVLANLKLDETRIPQDGRITLKVDQRKIDFRVSTMPLLDNEKAVLRILQSSDEVPSLEELGFHQYHIDMIRQNIQQPHGLFLVSGPTGSGKSTTLYTVLNILNNDGVNIVTLEDPIEFYLPGVNQSQIKPEVAFDFASGLRSILRQDPNIIMVGEIRDGQTAEMAIHAGLTGHLIFSTIHTNNAIGVVPRLVDMGVEPFLLASTLNIIIAQRLTRKICTACKAVATIPDYLLKKIQTELQDVDPAIVPDNVDLKKLVFYRGAGCDRCGQTGYQGRLAIAEALAVTTNLQRLIVSGYNVDEVKKERTNQKMLTLFQDGLLRALEGMTTLDEVLRVVEE